jgi:hypothetical protein
VDLLLILYAMIAGLAGFNPGSSTMTRGPEIAQGQVMASRPAAQAEQAAIAFRALAVRATEIRRLPVSAIPDPRLTAVDVVVPLLVSGRAAPERRLE